MPQSLRLRSLYIMITNPDVTVAFVAVWFSSVVHLTMEMTRCIVIDAISPKSLFVVLVDVQEETDESEVTVEEVT